ncbi:hypothetical protein N2152v2_002110 [Parachlorella kessleri]
MALSLTAQMANLRVSAKAPTLKRFEGFKAAAAFKNAPTAKAVQVAFRKAPLRIECARVGGVEIPNQKFVEFSLQYIYGIGHTTAKAIVASTGIQNKRVKELSDEVAHIDALQGIENKRVKELFESSFPQGIENKRVKELSEEELTTLREEVDKYTTEGDLRRFNSLNIKRLKEIGCYRGRRHINNLPVRGQRTKNNSRTRKGKAKPIAGKKIGRK